MWMQGIRSAAQSAVGDGWQRVGRANADSAKDRRRHRRGHRPVTVDRYELGLAIAGLVALLAAWLPAYTDDRPMSLPVVLLGLGVVTFALPLGFVDPDVFGNLEIVERVTEFAVIIALMGAALKIDQPFGWRSWAPTWRALLIGMPVTIAATALLGVIVGGLTAVTAFLLGAVIAPTDPVLASDVQVGEPTVEQDADDAPESETERDGDGDGDEDDVRLTLTSEGGLNDALAFPFVYAAIRIADKGGSPSAWLAEWLAWDLVGRIVIGVAVGWLVGRLLGIVTFRPPGRLSPLAEIPQGFVVVAATLIAYGATEVVGGYGFLAVFVSGIVLRNAERDHGFHSEMHGFAGQLENLITVGLLLLLGGTLVTGSLDALTWPGAIVAVLVVVVVRPIAGWSSFVGSDIAGGERWAIAFFGIRGFGSVYYLAYALGHTQFEGAKELVAIVILTLVISIVVHGIAATPVMRALDRKQQDPAVTG